MNQFLIAIVLCCLTTGSLSSVLKSQKYGNLCNEQVTCDASVGLFCGENEICSCKQSQTYSHNIEQCLSLVNAVCEVHEDKSMCVENSECVSNSLHESSGVCHCIRGYEARNGYCVDTTHMVEIVVDTNNEMDLMQGTASSSETPGAGPSTEEESGPGPTTEEASGPGPTTEEASGPGPTTEEGSGAGTSTEGNPGADPTTQAGASLGLTSSFVLLISVQIFVSL